MVKAGAELTEPGKENIILPGIQFGKVDLMPVLPDSSRERMDTLRKTRADQTVTLTRSMPGTRL
jgi:hypothetical protein